LKPDQAQKLAQDLTNTFCDKDWLLAGGLMGAAALSAGIPLQDLSMDALRKVDWDKLNLQNSVKFLLKSSINDFLQRLPTQDRQPMLDLLKQHGVEIPRMEQR
jgi:hypothetical protein